MALAWFERGGHSRWPGFGSQALRHGDGLVGEYSHQLRKPYHATSHPFGSKSVITNHGSA